MKATKKRYKQSTNYSLDPDARWIAQQIKAEDDRSSEVNVIEHLLFAEARRRGLNWKGARK